MADPPSPGIRDDGGMRSEPGSPPATPRWVKVSGVIALLVLLLFVVLALAGGAHGPGRHTGGGGGDPTPPPGVTEHGPPAGGHTP